VIVRAMGKLEGCKREHPLDAGFVGNLKTGDQQGSDPTLETEVREVSGRLDDGEMRQGNKAVPLAIATSQGVGGAAKKTKIGPQWKVGNG